MEDDQAMAVVIGFSILITTVMLQWVVPVQLDARGVIVGVLVFVLSFFSMLLVVAAASK
jgi:hypothetical protein